MTRKSGLQITGVAAAALAGLGLPVEAATTVASETGDGVMMYLGEVLIAGSVAGALLLLDTKSWSWMTTRR